MTIPHDALQPTISVLQTALTPAFLLVSLGNLLNLYSGRLSRIVDRTRALAARHGQLSGQELLDTVAELRLLEHRMKIVSASILFGVLGAIAVCAMIGFLFMLGLSGSTDGGLIMASFLLALGLLATSLLFYVREVQLATRNIRIRSELLQWPERRESD